MTSVTHQSEHVGGGEESCPFCQIANGGDRNVLVVAEAPEWVAFFPPEPAACGHTLIIPRVHVRDFWALETQLACSLTQAARQVGVAMRRVIEPDGLNLITSAGGAAEQTVFHVHLHVVPRWSSDGFGPIWPDADVTDADSRLPAIAALMHDALTSAEHVD
jgi:histidine triad (HIT) family protein